jgi:hypothetical protein
VRWRRRRGYRTAPEVDGRLCRRASRAGLGFRPRTRHRAGPARSGPRHLRRLGARPAGGDLDRDESALRRHRAACRGVPARPRGGPVRTPARGRVMGAAARRGRLRLGSGARGADRGRRPPHTRGATPSVSFYHRRDLRGYGSRHEPAQPAGGARERPLPRMRRRLRQALRRRNERQEPGLPRLRVCRLDPGQARSRSASPTPLLRGSAAAPCPPIAVTPPK